MHGARSAQGHPAAELGAGESQLITERPQEGSVVGEVDVVAPAVDGDRGHRDSPLDVTIKERLAGALRHSAK
jgi:hypothetical protein